MNIWICAVFTGYLIVASYYDVRTKEVPVWLYIIAGMIGCGCFGYTMIVGQIELIPFACAMAPGSLLYVLNRLRCGVGMGDVLLYFVNVFYLPGYENLELFIYSILTSGIVGMAIFMKGRFQGNSQGENTFPFIPCVLVGWIIVVGFRMTGTYV